MTKMSYYMQMKPEVLKTLKAYKDDFLVQDRKLLKNYKGRFLLALRETGTNIILFDKIDIKEYSPEGKADSKVWIFGYNNIFFYGDKGYVKMVSKEDAESIFNEIMEVE